jgi:hypothetical protein
MAAPPLFSRTTSFMARAEGFNSMEVHFTPEQEAQLAQIAASAGTDTEHLVKDAALRLLAGNGDTPKAPQPTRANPLPVWHLGVIGSLHRRDIYNDVR